MMSLNNNKNRIKQNNNRIKILSMKKIVFQIKDLQMKEFKTQIQRINQPMKKRKQTVMNCKRKMISIKINQK